MTAPQRQPAAALREARDRKFREWFEDRRWRIADDWTGERSIMASVRGVNTIVGVKFTQGRFALDAPGRFHTPLGHGGRHGVVIIELDDQGQDKVPEQAAAFGLTTLKRAQAAYGLIVGLPDGS